MPPFLICSNCSGYPGGTPEDARLTPAAAEDVEETLAFALRFDGRKRAHGADELMAWITAKRLVKHLDRAGFVVMRKPPSSDLSRLQSGQAVARCRST
jgi:hypothetical protein